MLEYVADKSDKLFLWVQVKPYLSGFTWLMGVGSL